MQMLQPLFASRMPVVLRLYVAGIVGVTLTARFADMAEALQCILHATGSSGLGWLHEAVSLIPAQSATTQDKENFMSILVQSLQANPNNAGELEQGAWCVPSLHSFPLNIELIGVCFVGNDMSVCATSLDRGVWFDRYGFCTCTSCHV